MHVTKHRVVKETDYSETHCQKIFLNPDTGYQSEPSQEKRNDRVISIEAVQGAHKQVLHG